MTKSKDKLIALSGLAHSYYERDGQSGASYKTSKGGRQGKYAAGLWEADMPSALLWRTLLWRNRSAQRPLDYWAPSWSWASVDGRISYDCQMLHTEPINGRLDLELVPLLPRRSSEYDFGAFRVEEIEMTTSSSDPMGAVSAGYITVTGLIAVAIIDEEAYNISQSGSPSRYTWLRDPNRLVVGALLADVQAEIRTNHIYCVGVRDEQGGSSIEVPEKLDKVYRFRSRNLRNLERVEMVMGLGLTEIGEEEDRKVFKRLGLVRWVRKNLFAGKEVSTIKII